MSYDHGQEAGEFVVPLRYTQHARQRMAQREISAEDVERTVADPDITYPDPKGNVNCVRGEIRVVVDPRTWEVITVVRR